MRKKLLQNMLFAAMAAWVLYLAHTQAEAAQGSDVLATALFVVAR